MRDDDEEGRGRAATPPGRVTPDEYLGEVLDLVARVPAGRAVTYGSLAEVLRERLGVGGPRQVGLVLARGGGDVPWWRVVNAAGSPPRPYRREALERLRAEGCPLRGEGADARVVLRTALWWPEDEGPGEERPR